MTRPRYRFDFPTSDAWATAPVSSSPAGPGTAFSIMLTMPDEMRLSPKAIARPTRAMVACTSSRPTRKANERAWVKPSARRIRWKAELNRVRRPQVRSASLASSPVSSQVSGTGAAVLTTRLGVAALGRRVGGTQIRTAPGRTLIFSFLASPRWPPSSS